MIIVTEVAGGRWIPDSTNLVNLILINFGEAGPWITISMIYGIACSYYVRKAHELIGKAISANVSAQVERSLTTESEMVVSSEFQALRWPILTNIRVIYEKNVHEYNNTVTVVKTGAVLPVPTIVAIEKTHKR